MREVNAYPSQTTNQFLVRRPSDLLKSATALCGWCWIKSPTIHRTGRREVAPENRTGV